MPQEEGTFCENNEATSLDNRWEIKAWVSDPEHTTTLVRELFRQQKQEKSSESSNFTPSKNLWTGLKMCVRAKEPPNPTQLGVSTGWNKRQVIGHPKRKKKLDKNQKGLRMNNCKLEFHKIIISFQNYQQVEIMLL